MKAFAKVISIVAIAFFAACKKDGNKVSSETIALIQNKWSLISSTRTYPTNTSLNARYIGAATDYYQFSANDSFKIRQAGQIGVPNLPLTLDSKYSIVNNRTIAYHLNPSVEASIQELSKDVLILTNAITATIANGSATTTYEGTKTDSLRR